jgi:hypothetical protein
LKSGAPTQTWHCPMRRIMVSQNFIDCRHRCPSVGKAKGAQP